MAIALRKTGISVGGDVPWGSLLFCALIARYGGVKPSLLAIALSLLAFKYYFMTPLHSVAVKTREIPRRLLIFLLALVSPAVVAQTTVETPRTIRAGWFQGCAR